jgi:two-component system, OmpR family, sensor kinase
VRLRVKLALVAAGLTLLGTGVGLALTYVGLLNARVGALDDESRLLATLVYEASVLRDDQTVRVPAVVGSYLTGERGSAAAHVYVDNQLIWSAGAANAPRPLDPERLLAGGGASTAGDWRVYTFRDEEAGMVVQVGRPLQGLREVLGPYPGVALGVVAVVTVLAGWLAWSVVGLALRPLRRLAESAEHIDRTADMPAIAGSDEPARLSQAFTALLERLRGEREREHRFLAYAAHELRTPLSALRAGLEAVQAGRLELGPELVRRLHREATRLEALAQNLLALSSAEVGDARLERVDLERVAADAYDRFLPLAVEKGLTLELDAASTWVTGDARLLDQALGNLVSNAVRATSAGSVSIRAGTEQDVAYLEVVDTGTGMGQATEGRGLGLRVVRAVAAAHGGRLSFQDGDEGGTRARLRLPRSA